MHRDIDVATGIGTDCEIGSVPDTDTDTCRSTCTHMYTYTYTSMNRVRYWCWHHTFFGYFRPDLGRSELILFRRYTFLSLVLSPLPPFPSMFNDSRFTVLFFSHQPKKLGTCLFKRLTLHIYIYMHALHCNSTAVQLHCIGRRHINADADT